MPQRLSNHQSYVNTMDLTPLLTLNGVRAKIESASGEGVELSLQDLTRGLFTDLKFFVFRNSKQL